MLLLLLKLFKLLWKFIYIAVLLFLLVFLVSSLFSIKCWIGVFSGTFYRETGTFYRGKRVKNLPSFEISSAQQKQTSRVLPWNTRGLVVHCSRVFVCSMVHYIIWKNAFYWKNGLLFFFPSFENTNGKIEKKFYPSSPFAMTSEKELQAQKALELKEIDVIDAYKRKKKKHRDKCMRKYPRKIIYKSLRDALLLNSTSHEREAFWEQERFGYIRSGHVQSREYQLDDPVHFWHRMKMEQLLDGRCSQRDTVCI